MTRHVWTPEQLDAFREEVAAGGSTKAIAARLTLRLGFTVTKNGVIGRCDRLGIKSSSPGGAVAARSGGAPTRAQDEALLHILAMHSAGMRLHQIRARLNWRLTIAEIRTRIADVIRDDAAEEGWSTVGTWRQVAA